MSRLCVNVDHVATIRQARGVDYPDPLAAARLAEEAALEHRPDQVTLVPERPEEITTEGGLDLVGQHEPVAAAVDRLAAAAIDVSIFVDPDTRQLESLKALGGRGVSGFEINTDRYSRAEAGQLKLIQKIAADGAEAGLLVYAGHGLTTTNVGPVAAVPEIEELNIGHALVSRAVLIGMAAAVREMLDAMAGDPPGRQA
jgi:pyridoxine 5-phosphate synthase